MASNDPSDTGGLFIGRRPGTAPLRYRARPTTAGPGRRQVDRWLAHALLGAEGLLVLSLFGPQPALWLWFGSRVQYWTDRVEAGIVAEFAGMWLTVILTLMLAKRIDHAWRLVRRAAGYDQQRGALERVFVACVAVAAVCFAIWFLLINGPGSSVFSGQGG